MGSDDEEVRALVIAYAERLDAGDLDGVAALFDHGVVRTSATGAVRTGRDAVRRMYDPVRRYEDGTSRTKHVLGNLEVAVDGVAGTAVSSCTFTVVQGAPGSRLAPILAGRYDDRLERVDGAWRLVERRITPDLLGDLSGHMRGA